MYAYRRILTGLQLDSMLPHTRDIQSNVRCRVRAAVPVVLACGHSVCDLVADQTGAGVGPVSHTRALSSAWTRRELVYELSIRIHVFLKVVRLFYSISRCPVDGVCGQHHLAINGFRCSVVDAHHLRHRVQDIAASYVGERAPGTG